MRTASFPKVGKKGGVRSSPSAAGLASAKNDRRRSPGAARESGLSRGNLQRAGAIGVERKRPFLFAAAQVDDFEELQGEEDPETGRRIGDVERDAVERDAPFVREAVE